MKFSSLEALRKQLVSKPYWFSVDKFYKDETFETELSDDVDITPGMLIYVKGKEAIIHNFDYTGAVQEINLTAGTYKLEC